jgi:acyl-CoA reductase-like NAD-dependent aldehyde dehydrogenase
VLTFRDEVEAYRIANDTRFGLAAYVWTQDLNRVLRASAEIHAGTVWVNTPLVRDLRSAFGGFKESGFGREGGRGCEEFYTEEKSTIVALGDAPIRRLGAAAATDNV